MANKVEQTEKNYDVIVRLKRGGDYGTIFATKIVGNWKTDKAVDVYVKQKNGTEKIREINSDSIEEIERTV